MKTKRKKVITEISPDEMVHNTIIFKSFNQDIKRDLIESFLSQLLLIRGQIPRPVAELEAFTHTTDRRMLRKARRIGHFLGSLQSFFNLPSTTFHETEAICIIFGTSMYSPREIYFLRLLNSDDACFKELDDDKNLINSPTKRRKRDLYRKEAVARKLAMHMIKNCSRLYDDGIVTRVHILLGSRENASLNSVPTGFIPRDEFSLKRLQLRVNDFSMPLHVFEISSNCTEGHKAFLGWSDWEENLSWISWQASLKGILVRL